MMNADDKIQQQIEAYLNQDMSDLDRSRFEKMIHDDPELHEEVEMQESVLEAIRAERMLALKAGLSSVNISMWSTGLMEVAKIVAITAGLGVSVFAGYEIYNSQNSESDGRIKMVVPASASKVNSPDSDKTSELNATNPDSKRTIEPTESKDFESTPSHAVAPHPERSNPGTSSSGSKISVPFSSSVALGQKEDRNAQNQVTSKTTKEQFGGELIEPITKSVQDLSTKDFVLPSDGITNKSSLESVHPEVVIKRDNKDRFHYQFSDNKLVLYADFSDKLYEVLELNQDNTKRIFFCYDNKFYQLNPSQIDIAPLKEVQDKGLIQILMAYQKRKN